MRSNVSANRPLHSAELARLAGVSTDTLRYYERLRLLPAAPRSTSGYRQFPHQALTRVRLIRGALAIGFSVRELAAICTERDRGGAPCHRVRALAVKKLAAVEGALRDLQSWRRELKSTLAGWDRLLRKTPRGQCAGLLESFVAAHPTRQTRSPFVTPLASGHHNRCDLPCSASTHPIATFLDQNTSVQLRRFQSNYSPKRAILGANSGKSEA